MPAKEKQGPPKRGLYRRNTDDDIYFYLGTFGFLTAEELARLSGRNVVSLRKRLRQLADPEINHLGRVEPNKQRQEFFQEIECDHCKAVYELKNVKCEKCRKPIKLPSRFSGRMDPKPLIYYLKPKGGDRARPLIDHPIVWREEPRRTDHDRVLTFVHLSFHLGFGTALSDWLQQKDDVKETVETDEGAVSFYPDGRCFLNETLLVLQEEREVWAELLKLEQMATVVTALVVEVLRLERLETDTTVLQLFVRAVQVREVQPEEQAVLLALTVRVPILAEAAARTEVNQEAELVSVQVLTAVRES